MSDQLGLFVEPSRWWIETAAIEHGSPTGGRFAYGFVVSESQPWWEERVFRLPAPPPWPDGVGLGGQDGAARWVRHVEEPPRAPARRRGEPREVRRDRARCRP